MYRSPKAGNRGGEVTERDLTDKPETMFSAAARVAGERFCAPE
jgi:hypothetical protein